MGREARNDIGGQVTGDGRLEGVDKVQKKHATLEVSDLDKDKDCRNYLQGISNNERGSRPSQSDSLRILHTSLSGLVGEVLLRFRCWRHVLLVRDDILFLLSRAN